MGLEFKLKVFGREYEGNPFFKRVSLNNTRTDFKKMIPLQDYLCDEETRALKYSPYPRLSALTLETGS